MFQLNGKEYLVTVNYYINYWEVDQLEKTTPEASSFILGDTLARHEIPITVGSDNGSQFRSEKFKHFANGWIFNQVTSSLGFQTAKEKLRVQ